MRQFVPIRSGYSKPPGSRTRVFGSFQNQGRRIQEGSKIGVPHLQQIEWFDEARQQFEATRPIRDLWPPAEIKSTYLRESEVAQAENVRDGRNGGTEKQVGSQSCFQRRKRGLRAVSAIGDDSGIDT